MKKIILMNILFLLIIILNACSFFSLPRVNQLVKVDFYDYVYQNVSNQSIEMYFHDLEEVPYMSINQFIYLTPSYLSVDIEIAHMDNNGFSLMYQETNTETMFVLTYDHTLKNIQLNHIEFLMFLDDDDMYPNSYYLTDIEEKQTWNFSKPITYDLGTYQLSGIIYEEEFYLPLSVLNLFFKSFNRNLYFNGESLYATDDELYNVEFLNKYINEEIPYDLKIHTLDYLAFYFDYFYGLNFDLKPYFYKDHFEELKFDLNGKTHDFYELIYTLIEDFDDLHMEFSFEGYYGQDFDFDSLSYTYKGRKKLDLDSYELFQEYCRNNKSKKLNDNISLIAINEFESYTPEIFALEKDLYVGTSTTDIIIDFTCNPGGLVTSMMDLLPYVIEGEFPITLKHHGLGHMHHYYFNSDIKRLNQNIYIKTSFLTYSAANIFAMYAAIYGNAVVIGEKSNGGSSTVEVIFAPAGILINVPHMFHFSTLTGLNVEYGIDVDIDFTSLDMDELAKVIESKRVN